MPVCEKCGKLFPNWIKLEGKRKNLSSRKYCLECSPWGKHNTKVLKDKAFNNKYCIICEKKLTGNQSKFCSHKCKLKFHYNYEKKKLYIEKNKNKIRENNKKYREQRKKLKLKYIGNKCFICNYEKRILAHKKDGSNHPSLSKMGRKQLEEYLKEHSKEFIPLCFKCHKHIHWCMEYLGLTWEDIEKFIREKI